VHARLTYDNGEVYTESAPVVVQVDDHHGELPSTELSISTDRDADDYWVGQTATLTAEQSAPTGLTEYRWLTKAPGADDFTVVDGADDAEYAFKPTLENSGVQVKVQLLHDDEIHAESDAVTITAQQRDVVTELTATADKETYVPGDTALLTSAQNPQTDHEHYHWYVKRAGDTEFTWVDQSRDKDLAYPVTAEDDGAQLVLRMFDDTHAVIAESDPVTLTVLAEAPEAPGADDGAGNDAPADADGGGNTDDTGDATNTAGGGLAVTGGELGGAVLGGGILLLLAGAAVLFAMRRRSATAGDNQQ
jgi:hypothetical protein